MIEVVGLQAEPSPGATLFATYEPCVSQHPEVVANGWLTQGHLRRQIAYAGTAFARVSNDGKQLDPRWVGEGFE